MDIMSIASGVNGWFTSQITFDPTDDENGSIKETMVITIVHNLPVNGSINTIEAAVDNWLIRTEEYTDKSLVEYINSKSHMSGHEAMIYEDFNAKFQGK